MACPPSSENLRSKVDGGSQIGGGDCTRLSDWRWRLHKAGKIFRTPLPNPEWNSCWRTRNPIEDRTRTVSFSVTSLSASREKLKWQIFCLVLTRWESMDIPVSSSTSLSSPSTSNSTLEIFRSWLTSHRNFSLVMEHFFETRLTSLPAFVSSS